MLAALKTKFKRVNAIIGHMDENTIKSLSHQYLMEDAYTNACTAEMDLFIRRYLSPAVAIQNIDDLGNSSDVGDVDDLGNSSDVGDVDDLGNSSDVGDVGDVDDLGNLSDVGDVDIDNNNNQILEEISEETTIEQLESLVEPQFCHHLVDELIATIKNIDNVSLFSIEQRGRAVYAQNPNMRDIGEFMQHPETKAFYDKHFNNWSNVTATMLNLKLYRKAEEILAKNGIDGNGYHKLAIIDILMRTSKIRHLICDEMAKWMYETSFGAKAGLIQQK